MKTDSHHRAGRPFAVSGGEVAWEVGRGLAGVECLVAAADHAVAGGAIDADISPELALALAAWDPQVNTVEDLSLLTQQLVVPSESLAEKKWVYAAVSWTAKHVTDDRSLWAALDLLGSHFDNPAYYELVYYFDTGGPMAGRPVREQVEGFLRRLAADLIVPTETRGRR